MNPYESPPPFSSPNEAASAVKGPALALMIVSGIWLGSMLLCVLPFDVFLLVSGATDDLPPPAGMDKSTQIIIRMFFGVLLAAASAFVFYGAMQMKNLRNYQMAYAASVVACIPCIGPCYLLGIPFGIWGLVVLSREEVKKAFQ